MKNVDGKAHIGGDFREEPNSSATLNKGVEVKYEESQSSARSPNNSQHVVVHSGVAFRELPSDPIPRDPSQTGGLSEHQKPSLRGTQPRIIESEAARLTSSVSVPVEGEHIATSAAAVGREVSFAGGSFPRVTVGVALPNEITVRTLRSTTPRTPVVQVPRSYIGALKQNVVLGDIFTLSPDIVRLSEGAHPRHDVAEPALAYSDPDPSTGSRGSLVIGAEYLASATGADWATRNDFLGWFQSFAPPDFVFGSVDTPRTWRPVGGHWRGNTSIATPPAGVLPGVVAIAQLAIIGAGAVGAFGGGVDNHVAIGLSIDGGVSFPGGTLATTEAISAFGTDTPDVKFADDGTIWCMWGVGVAFVGAGPYLRGGRVTAAPITGLPVVEWFTPVIDAGQHPILVSFAVRVNPTPGGGYVIVMTSVDAVRAPNVSLNIARIDVGPTGEGASARRLVTLPIPVVPNVPARSSLGVLQLNPPRASILVSSLDDRVYIAFARQADDGRSAVSVIVSRDSLFDLGPASFDPGDAHQIWRAERTSQFMPVLAESRDVPGCLALSWIESNQPVDDSESDGDSDAVFATAMVDGVWGVDPARISPWLQSPTSPDTAFDTTGASRAFQDHIAITSVRSSSSFGTASHPSFVVAWTRATRSDSRIQCATLFVRS